MESGGLFEQFGIDWKLFLSQAVNFFILLLVLRFFVYKPLLITIKKRQARIEEGLQKAKEADIRLKEIDDIAKKNLKKADQEAQQIIKNTYYRAESLQEELFGQVQDHHKELMARAELAYQRKQEETRDLVFKEALELVKKTFIKTVQLKPEMVDEALIKKAVSQIKEENV